MLLICETVEEASFITEDDGSGGKNFFIEGVFMQGNIKNRNGRFYPTEVIEREVNRYNAEYVQKNRAYGELGHPEGPTINLDRVSHMITELYRNGDNFIGKAKINDNPMGKIVQGFITMGANLGVSSRGMGTLKQKRGVMEVQSDFRLATAADIVAEPSAPEAFVHGIMEGVEWIFDIASNSYISANVLDEIEDKLPKMTLAEIADNQMAMLNKFINSL